MRRRIIVGWMASALLLTGQPAMARAYSNKEVDGLTVRCTTINLASLPEASRQRYGVSGGPDEGLLSCVVQAPARGSTPENVQADVHAEFHPIGQAPQPVPMREVREGDLVTYLGTYPVEGSHPLQFSVSLAVPGAGTAELTFDDPHPRL